MLMIKNQSFYPRTIVLTKHMLACATNMTINKESGGLPPVNPAAVIFALHLKQRTTPMRSGSIL